VANVGHWLALGATVDELRARAAHIGTSLPIHAEVSIVDSAATVGGGAFPTARIPSVALRFGANGFSREIFTQNHNTNVGAAWGVNWLNVSPASYGYPVINVAGYATVGDAFGLPILRDSKTYQIADDLSVDRGDHLIKIGGEFRHIALDSKVDLFSRGQLSFTGAFTGSGIGDLLLGLPTFGIQAQANNPIAMRTNAASVFVQDDWRVRPAVTTANPPGARWDRARSKNSRVVRWKGM